MSTSDSARTAFDFAKMFERMKEGTGTLLAIDSGDVPWINISDVIPSDDGIEDEPEILFLPTQAEGFEQISLEELFNIAKTRRKNTCRAVNFEKFCYIKMWKSNFKRIRLF